MDWLGEVNIIETEMHSSAKSLTATQSDKEERLSRRDHNRVRRQSETDKERQARFYGATKCK